VTVGRNDDGSVDVFFGPDAPAGIDGNWICTVHVATGEITPHEGGLP